jgi:hypothetical protein
MHRSQNVGESVLTFFSYPVRRYVPPNCQCVLHPLTLLTPLLTGCVLNFDLLMPCVVAHPLSLCGVRFPLDRDDLPDRRDFTGLPNLSIYLVIVTMFCRSRHPYWTPFLIPWCVPHRDTRPPTTLHHPAVPSPRLR